ncbi:MAG TPA: serine/threonine-protein kinase [Kofleriaceae bacterium]|nr:serine/threonine-protein kinase [Kofleriaceae bacterium]
MYSESPRTLGKYRLIAEIARGGMGIVYLAMAQGPAGFSKLLVVKELKPELTEEPAFLKMFLEEARLAARLNHPNIVQTNEVGADGTRYFMAMDYLDGRGLERVRRRARHLHTTTFTLAMQLRVLSEVLTGLEYAHTFEDYDGTVLGIVHRDISPQNVFVTFDGQIKLLDFGIAKTIDSVVETRAGVLKGKLSYMAPEQARGERVDARADIFGAGVMMWEILTGRSLHQGESEQKILSDLIARVDLPRASAIKPDVSPILDDICAKALAMDRDHRYHSASAMQAELDTYLNSLHTTVGNREVGAAVRELFREDRARTSAMIEKYVARVRTGEAQEDDDLPIIDVSYSPADARTPVAEPPAGMSTPSNVEPRVSGSHSAQRQVGSLDVEAPSAVIAASPSRVHPPAPRRAKWWVLPAAMIGGIAVGGLLYTVLSHPHDKPAAVAQAPTPPTPPLAMPQTPAPPPSPPPPSPSKLVEIDIRCEPEGAALEIDGASIANNPFHGKYVEDGAMHQIKVSAAGYIAKTEAVAFDGPVSLEVRLDRVPTPSDTHVVHTRIAPAIVHKAPPQPPPPPQPLVVAAPPSPAPVETPKPQPQPQQPVEVNPNGGSKPHRQIDPNNPYGN